METKTLSKTEYIGSRIAAILPGFGIGHAIQERYSENGVLFTTGGVVLTLGAGGFFASSVLSAARQKSMSRPDLPVISFARWISLGAVVVGAGIRVWEAIDIWVLPSNYKVVEGQPFQIKPIAFHDSNANLNLGLSLNYSF